MTKVIKFQPNVYGNEHDETDNHLTTMMKINSIMNEVASTYRIQKPNKDHENQYYVPDPTLVPYEKRKKLFPRIVVCGSVQFVKEILEIESLLTHGGWDVISFGVSHQIFRDRICDPMNTVEADEHKEYLNALWKQKLSETDAVYVVNPDGYIGESTRSEIAYADSIHKPIFYMHERED